MGKGYTEWESFAGADLKEHFQAAFVRKASARATEAGTFVVRLTVGRDSSWTSRHS